MVKEASFQIFFFLVVVVTEGVGVWGVLGVMSSEGSQQKELAVSRSGLQL